MTNIVVLDGYELNRDLHWELLSKLGNCNFYNRTPDDNNEILKRIGNADAIIIHKTLINKFILNSSPNLKYIGIMGTGYDVVDIDSAKKSGVIVSNVPTYASDAVAQFTFSLLLEVTSQVGLHNQLIHDNKWSEAPDFTFWSKPLFELKGKTMGLIGYGNIAQKVAKIAHAFSMNVIFYNHNAIPVTENWLKQVSLDELLEISDVISLHVIQTSDTINLINKHTISKMKPSVIVLNTARGKLINERDITDALNKGRIFALATDVVSKEPITKDNPLLTAKNCFITPHIAWAPLETRERLLQITINNLKLYLKGEAINIVY
ncbi:D-2-hydroxyacid dehydrogenase [Lactococcus lactis]|uniref:D-2-hydroxyacid dehydrogenase n=1 Tax=Lactococcus lactis TaxID=1358 RepID=UPI0027EC24EF|nr:D-2-hydroxyacid dehydrogenase [Lactococcus lactis]MDQ7188543.1 D-2-hydroxyacid dehydrogenase [Lactococcus lactis]